MNQREEIYQLAHQIVKETQSPLIQYILTKNIFVEESSDAKLEELKAKSLQNKGIEILKNEQWPDGSWGRLHSQDSKTKQRIPTTEYGVRRALYLGLELEDSILLRAHNYLISTLKTGKLRDPPEKNERWSTGVNLFCASTISLMDPLTPEITPQLILWSKILQKTFESGNYDYFKERKAHRNLTKIDGDLYYLVLNSVYHLDLFGSASHILSQKLIDSYLSWLWNDNIVINYLGISMNSYEGLSDKELWIWLDLMNRLSKFNGWKKYVAPAIDWLWTKQRRNGYWKFNPQNQRKYQLSDRWSSKNQEFDCTTVVLCLLNKYHSNP